jgi:TolA-binding protein
MRLGLRVAITLSILLTTGCHRKAPVVGPPVVASVPDPVPPPVPPSVLTLQAANREFGLGDYISAARNFEQYLNMVPSGGDRDQALFHLGLIYALPDETRQDWQRARTLLNQLATEFPQSSWKPVSQLILSLSDQASQLTIDAARLRNEAAQVRDEATQLRTTSSQLSDQLTKLKADADRLTAEVDKREKEIKQLKAELDRLIKIDSAPRRN